MTAAEILQELATETWVTLRPSPVHGIGVFAIRDIPKGCTTIFSKNIDNWVKLPIKKVEELPAHAKELVETYCLYDTEHYYVPDYGFKIMDMVNYLNHSATPNVLSINDGEYFEALSAIPAGTELFVSYERIVAVEGYE